MKELDTVVSEIVTLSRRNFKTEVIESDLPVLVNFWASWCGPCRRLAPVIEEVARDCRGRVKVAKLNVEENGDIASRYMVMSVPALLIFKGGKPVERLVGLQTKDAILEKLKRSLE